MDEFISEKLDLPVAKDEPPRSPAAGAVRIEAAEAVLRAGASPSSGAIATARKGTVLPVDARFGEFYRVEWAKGRFAFAAEGDVKPTRAPRQGAAVEAWQREPPRIALVPDPLHGSPVTEGDKFHIQGTALVPPSADPSARLRDVFVFVNDQKVFFKVVPESAAAPKLEFQTDVPLKPGINTVTVFAREDDEFQARRSVVVFRRAQAQVAQQAGAQAGARAQ